MRHKILLIFIIFNIIPLIWSQSFDNEKQDFLRAIEKRESSLKIKQFYDNRLLEAINSINVSLVEQLLNNGADPNGYKNESDISPLGMACNKGNLEIVKLLLEFGANPNYIPKGNMSALSYAVIGTEKPEIVKYLIYAGVDINFKTSTSDPAIFWSILLGNDVVAKLLYENGADITIRNKDNQTPIDLAKTIGRKNIFEILSGSENITDMKKLIVISTDKLSRNLLDIQNNIYYEPFWNNEIIAVPRGYLEVIEINKTMWGAIRYLVAINGTLSTLKPFYIESKRNIKTIYTQYKDLIYEDINIRKTNYIKYNDNRIEKETFLFRLAEEI
jgi:hypothetical protein